MENQNEEKNTNQLDPKITKAIDKLFVDAKAGDQDALKVLIEIFHTHFKEMQKIRFQEQMWRNHKAWCERNKNRFRYGKVC